MSHRIAISSGDYNGIGPEVILKCLSNLKDNNDTIIILSAPKVIDFYSKLLDIPLSRQNVRAIDEVQSGKVNVLECYNKGDINIDPGKLSQSAGKCAMMAVEKGIELCNNGLADALVTAPISKEAVNLAGYHIPGHTEFLAEHTNTTDFMMMLVNENLNLRVGLASVHIPIADVPKKITEESIIQYLRIMNGSLQRDFNIARPRIAVFGLNPHAGDGGIIGKEEQDIISPAIQKAQDLSINASGPHAADGFFGNKKYENCDGILAMYHDQGLVPFKALSFGAGVNFTAGLPIVRTSPDHGTAFDIAGKGKANPSSFEQAFSLARQLTANRKQKKL